MVFPVGIGGGDFVIALKLVTKVVKALKESGGAASEYQDVTLELETLSRILDHVGSSSYISSISENHANAIRGLVLNCNRPLEHFLDKIASFEASLGAATDRGFVRTSAKKVKWAVFLKSEIPKLRSLVAAKTLQLQLLLQCFSFEASSVAHTKFDELDRKATAIQESIDLQTQADGEALAVAAKWTDRLSRKFSSQLDLISRCQNRYFPVLLQYAKSISEASQNSTHIPREYFPRVFSAFRLTNVKIDELRVIGAQLVTVSRTGPKKIRDLLKKLCETNAQIYTAILQIQSTLDMSRPLAVQDGVYFEDALGREFTLPYEFFCEWEIFEALLKVQFKARPGEENIRTGNFCLREKAQSQLVKKEDWSKVVLPGTRVLMSMILPSVITVGERCPRGCDTPSKTILNNLTCFVCPICGLQYNSLDRLVEPCAQKSSDLAAFVDSWSLELCDSSKNDYENNHYYKEERREAQELEFFKRVYISIAPESSPLLEPEPEADAESLWGFGTFTKDSKKEANELVFDEPDITMTSVVAHENVAEPEPEVDFGEVDFGEGVFGGWGTGKKAKKKKDIELVFDEPDVVTTSVVAHEMEAMTEPEFEAWLSWRKPSTKEKKKKPKEREIKNPDEENLMASPAAKPDPEPDYDWNLDWMSFPNTKKKKKTKKIPVDELHNAEDQMITVIVQPN